MTDDELTAATAAANEQFGLPLPPPLATPPELAWLPREDAIRLYQQAGGIWPAGRQAPIGAYAGAYWPWLAAGAAVLAFVLWRRGR